MFALDLFNTKYEKELSEGAVDNLQARRIDDLNMKMLDLLDRVKGANPKMRDGLKREFQKVKAERDGYFKINPATGMNDAGTLGTTKGKLDEQDDGPVAGAITRRILMQRHDLLKQYGPELVGVAIDNVADYVGDVDEIGSSDVSAWVSQVERMLKENPPEAFAEESKPYGDYKQSPRAFGAGNFQRIVKANMGNLPGVTLEFSDTNDNIHLDKQGIDLISDYYDGLENDSIKNHFIYRVLPSADEVLTVLKKLGWNQAVQPELPGIPTQGELPLQEKKKFEPKSDVAAGDVKVARELQKLRAQYPAAKSDVEAVAKSEIDSNERSQQQLASIKGANAEQDQLLKQLVALDQKQGKEIGSLDSENDRLEQQLAHVEKTNANLAQAISQMGGQDQSANSTDNASGSPSRTIDLIPNAPADITQPATVAEPEEPRQKFKSKSNTMSRMAQDLVQPRKVQGITSGPAPSIRGNDPAANDDAQQTAVGQNESLDEGQRLHPGDPVVVTAPNEFEGKTGEIYDFSPSGKFVIVDLYNHGKHSMHLSDVAYNDYADQEETDDWYDEGMDEGWKSNLGGAALAGAMALGAGGAHARVAGDYVDNPDINRLTGKPKVTQAVQGNQVKPSAPTGFSKEYLQSVVDGTHPRPMISKEKAQQMLDQMATPSYPKVSPYNDDASTLKVYKPEQYREAANPAQQAAIAIAKKKKQGVTETALNPKDPKGDYAAKRKALQDLGMNKDVDQQAVLQRRLDLDKEAKSKGVNEAVNTMRQQAGKMIDKYFGQIYEYGDSGLNYLDRHAPTWYKLFDQHDGDIDVIIATAPANLLVKATQELKAVAGNLSSELDEQGVAEGRPEDLPGIDYDRLGDRPRKQSSGKHNPYPYSPEEDNDYFREIFRKKREAATKAKAQGGSLNEFAPGQGGGSGNYFQALASAWYNGAFDTGSLQKGIKSKEDVERLLQRGVLCPDGVTRKFGIDYNSDFDGVVISSDDYYEHSDYNDQGQEVDSRTGQKWGPYDYMEFSDDELSESLNELSNEKLGQYKQAAALDAGAADRAGNFERGDKRFSGIVRATKKQFANDVKKHKEQGVAEGQTDYQKRRQRERDVDAGKPVSRQPKNPQTDYARKRAKEKRELEQFGESGKSAKEKFAQASYDREQKRKDFEKSIAHLPWAERMRLMRGEIEKNLNNKDVTETLMKEPTTRKEYLDQRDKLFRMMAVDSNPANKQIIKQALQDLEARYGKIKYPVREESSTSSDAVERAILNRIMVAHTNLLMQFGPEKVMQAAEEVAYNVGDVDEIGTSDVSAYVNQVRQILGVEA